MRYVITLAEWQLVIDAKSEEKARMWGAAELRGKIKPEYLSCREDPTARETEATQIIDIYTIRSRYTSPDNACKPEKIRQLAPIAIAHDIATLVGEIEQLRSRNAILEAELRGNE